MTGAPVMAAAAASATAPAATEGLAEAGAGASAAAACHGGQSQKASNQQSDLVFSIVSF